MNLTFKKTKTNTVPSEKFILESVQAFIKESKFPKQLVSKKLDLILEQYKAKVKKTRDSIKLMNKSLTSLKEKAEDLDNKNTKEIFRLKNELNKKGK